MEYNAKQTKVKRKRKTKHEHSFMHIVCFLLHTRLYDTSLQKNVYALFISIFTVGGIFQRNSKIFLKYEIYAIRKLT